MFIHLETWDPFYSHALTLLQAWISNYIHYNMYDEISNFQNKLRIYR